MINFTNVTDLKVQCQILQTIQEFNKKSYSQSQMDSVIQKFRQENGEEAVQELV